MSSVFRSLLWALAVSLLLAAVILFVLFRYVLPSERITRPAAYTIGV